MPELYESKIISDGTLVTKYHIKDYRGAPSPDFHQYSFRRKGQFIFFEYFYKFPSFKEEKIGGYGYCFAI